MSAHQDAGGPQALSGIESTVAEGPLEAPGTDLDAMALDPNIQREIREIEAEFAPALGDGLDED